MVFHSGRQAEGCPSAVRVTQEIHQTSVCCSDIPNFIYASMVKMLPL